MTDRREFVDRSELDRAVDELGAPLRDLALRIHQHPELRFEERQASSWMAELLEGFGPVRVERAVGGLPTAFRARAGQGEPRIALLAEYDALPEIGHACGHNLIAAGAAGAFLALSRFAERLSGSVEIVGTPAEEGGGGKIRLLEAGVFEGIAAAMMYHPFDRDILAHPALAGAWVTMRFRGKPAHAAAAPWSGSSALTACMQTFHLVDSQRVHFRDGVRVHGFITNGGQAVNIIPEHAACEFSVRALSQSELDRVLEIVERCARAAALACGAHLESDAQRGYRDMRNNMTIARRFGAALRALGRTPREVDSGVGSGSTDMGDVSHHIPSIHPYLAICEPGQTMCHELEFATCAKSEAGLSTMLIAAKAMARTALDLIEDPELLQQARNEFLSQANS